MTQTHQATVVLSPLDLSDWRKRIHQLKQELRDNAPNQNPRLPTQPLTYGSQPAARAAGREASKPAIASAPSTGAASSEDLSIGCSRNQDSSARQRGIPEVDLN